MTSTEIVSPWMPSSNARTRNGGLPPSCPLSNSALAVVGSAGGAAPTRTTYAAPPPLRK